MLRPLTPDDFRSWSRTRRTNDAWLTPWEPRRPASPFDPTTNQDAFEVRCRARDRDRNAGTGFAFGVFVGDRFVGETNLNNVLRGAMQSATLGYWIDEQHAGRAYTAESVVVAARFAFECLLLHRLEICIVPRNYNSHRVMQKLQLRDEGVARRFLEINGVWEDHVRYGFTAEEWAARGDELAATWL